MDFKDLNQFAEFLTSDLPVLLEVGKESGLQEAGKIWTDEMREELGTYQEGDEGFPDWPALAAKTLADKRRGGFPVPSPLNRTETLKESLGYETDGSAEMAAGSPDMVAVWQEDGTENADETVHVPERSFIARGAFRKTDEALNAIGRAAIGAITGVKIE